MPRKAKEKEIENTNVEEIVVSSKKSTNSSKKKTVSTKKDSKTENVKKITTEKKIKDVAKSTEKSDKPKVSKTRAPKNSGASNTDIVKATTTKKRRTKSDKIVDDPVIEPTVKKATKSVKKSNTDNNSDNTMSSSKKKSTKSSSTTASKTKKAKSATSAKSKKSKTNSVEIEILEYYDLPYKYGNTLVKLLAQTPKTLFVYWEISDLDISNYKEKYGDNFFFITKPILIVHNLTLDETYEVEINDFANCWYLNIENADCKYDIELARKFIQSPITKTAKKNEYLFISKSNDLTAPNDHILLEKLTNFVTFKDVSTGEHIKKNIKSFKFLNDLYEFYKNMYKDEILSNPSSNFSI